MRLPVLSLTGKKAIDGSRTMKRAFIDSNIIVSANDCQAGPKQSLAIQVVKDRMRDQTGVISTQVMQEYANVAIGKLNQDCSVVLRQLRLLERLSLSPITPQTTRRAVELLELYGISFWDANIIASAEAAGCDVILSEGLNTGQYYAGMEVVNPFAG